MLDPRGRVVTSEEFLHALEREKAARVTPGVGKLTAEREAMTPAVRLLHEVADEARGLGPDGLNIRTEIGKRLLDLEETARYEQINAHVGRKAPSGGVLGWLGAFSGVVLGSLLVELVYRWLGR
jgi:hypothetical protein